MDLQDCWTSQEPVESKSKIDRTWLNDLREVLDQNLKSGLFVRFQKHSDEKTAIIIFDFLPVHFYDKWNWPNSLFRCQRCNPTFMPIYIKFQLSLKLTFFFAHLQIAFLGVL